MTPGHHSGMDLEGARSDMTWVGPMLNKSTCKTTLLLPGSCDERQKQSDETGPQAAV